jgi:hypothetical protein
VNVKPSVVALNLRQMEASGCLPRKNIRVYGSLFG